MPVANTLLSLPLPETKAVAKAAAQSASGNETAELTRRLAAGDENAFRQFHAQYFDRLYRFLLAVTLGSEHDAREALQQTFLRVARYAREFQTEEIFWSWLKAVARSAARDAQRKQSRYARFLERLALRWRNQERATEPERDEPWRNFLEEELLRLDGAGRQLLEAKYIDGATVKEISAQSGLSEKAVESRLVRLRRQLREQLLKKLRAP